MQQSLLLRATLVGALLLNCASCCIPDLRKPKPAPCMPGDYNGKISEDNSAQIGACQFFDDPHLLGLFGQALMGNQELRILSEDITIANNEIMKRRGMLFPFFGARATAGLDKPSLYTPLGAAEEQLLTPEGRHFPDPLPNFLLAADVSWQIDIWRQLRNARDAATLRFLGTNDGVNYVVTRLVADIAENYYELTALDQQMETLDRTIALQEQSLNIAEARKEAARDTELAVQRFEAEVNKNRSEKAIIAQRIIETENTINFLVGRYPQPVERSSAGFLDLKLPALSVGVPAQLLRNRLAIRQAERELRAAGLEVRVARADFYPRLVLTAGVGYEAFNPSYLFSSPESLIYNAAGGLVAPMFNRSAIRADYLTANARQLQALYHYQRTILNAFTEVINQVSKVENYTRSIEVKRQQLNSLEEAVGVSGQLFQNARVEYIEVLLAQRDRNEARMVLIETKKEQLSAIVNAYQALGGGMRSSEIPQGALIRPIITEEEVIEEEGEPVPPPAPEKAADLPPPPALEAPKAPENAPQP